MKVGILVTNYNTWDMTSKCIEHCLKYADAPIDQFVVIDDCSTEVFENNFAEVTLIRNPTNIGLVKSLNKGLKALNTDLVFLFDSDAWPLEDYIVKTKEYFLNNPKVGIASFKIQNSEGVAGASSEAEPGAISIVLGQQLYSYYQKLNSAPQNITVYTCAMVLRKEVIEQVGGFDEGYDWLELDHDICMSASRKGWDISVMDLDAFHKGSGTPQKVAHRVIRFYKNRIKLLKKFNRYPVAGLLNSLIVLRLAIEYAAFSSIGRLKLDKEVLEDKLLSRSELIKLFLKKQI